MSIIPRLLAAGLLVAMAPAAATAQTTSPTMSQAPAGSGTRANPFTGLKSWAYQLKNLIPSKREKIASSNYDLVVIDYAESADSEVDVEENPLTAEQVAAMKVKPDGSKRLVIAYLSIGEAENYRYYWKPEWNKKPPAWKGPESKEWKGNFLVKYWDPAWQSIIYGNPGSYVDRIIAAGFDGFYLDRADAYYRYGDSEQARARMTQFVTELVAYIRSKKPDSGIMIQNAEELLDRPSFVNAIDAIAKEDLVFGISHREEKNKPSDIDWSNDLLKAAHAKGKRIFVVEYLTKPQNIAIAQEYMAKNDYVLYYGPRGLFEISDTPVAGPRRGPLDPTPDHPTAKEEVKTKANERRK